MAEYRVIAAEKQGSAFHEISSPVICCVYKDNTFYVYDTQGELYASKEFFSSYAHLKYLVDRKEYQWTDFWIKKGSIVTRDCGDNILADNSPICTFSPLDCGSSAASSISLKLYSQFLKGIHKDDASAVMMIENDYTSGELKNEIMQLVDGCIINGLSDDDRYLALRCRLEGCSFIISRVKEIMRSSGSYKLDEVHHLFSRIFILERNNYICFDRGKAGILG